MDEACGRAEWECEQLLDGVVPDDFGGLLEMLGGGEACLEHGICAGHVHCGEAEGCPEAAGEGDVLCSHVHTVEAGDGGEPKTRCRHTHMRLGKRAVRTGEDGEVKPAERCVSIHLERRRVSAVLIMRPRTAGNDSMKQSRTSGEGTLPVSEK